jgi:PAS domain S-box-containing protein
MASDHNKAITAEPGSKPFSGGADGSLIQQLIDARRAALNLMEDAVREKQRADELNTQLLREIEQRKRSEDTLRERERELESVISRTPFLLARCRQDMTYRFVSEAYAKMLGRRPEDIIGKRLIQVLGDAAFDVVEPYIQQVLEGKKVEFEAQLSLPDVGTRTLHVVYLQDRDEKGRVVGWIESILDLTSRKIAEEALRESEERLELLSESFHDFAIFTTDVDGNVATWNPGGEQIFGYREEEILGQNGRILFVPEDQEKGEPEKEMNAARTRGRAADERWHLRKDGRRFYASGIMAPLYEGKDLIGYAKIARDLTREKQMRDELQRQRDELESIVAGRTAELGEANQALRAQMEERRVIEEERFALLQKIVTTQEDERRRIARDIHDSLGQQLTALRLKIASMRTNLYNDGRIGESLELLQELGKRIDSEVNFLVWELRPTVLDDLGLVAALDNYVREWSKHVAIPAEFQAGRIGSERLDSNIETNLYRISQEALNNTYKHAKAKRASVLLESRRHELVLVIEDDGVGFETEKTRGVSESGRGLGLIGMRERAAIIDGSIEIESSPGKGTTVFVRVPIIQREVRNAGNNEDTFS